MGKAKAYMILMRPEVWVTDIITIFLAFSLAAPGLSLGVGFSFFMLFILWAVLSHSGSDVWNWYCDRVSDKGSKRRQVFNPVSEGLVSEESAMLLGILLATLASLFAVLFFPTIVAVFVIAFHLLSITYSGEPLRLKGVIFLPSVMMGLGWTFNFLASFFVFSQGAFGTVTYVFAIYTFLTLWAVVFPKDLVDVGTDCKDKKLKTAPIVFGVRKSVRMSSLFFPLAPIFLLIAVTMGLVPNYFIYAVIMVLIYEFFMLRQLHKDPTGVKTWKMCVVGGYTIMMAVPAAISLAFRFLF